MNRSRFLFRALKQFCVVEKCILVDSSSVCDESAALFIHGDGVSNPIKPHSVVSFSNREIEQVYDHVRNSRINICFFRCIAFADIASKLKSRLPDVRFVFDIDFIPSRLMQQAWQSNRSIRARFFLIQWLKLSVYERHLFRTDQRFLLSNEREVEHTRDKFPKTNFKHQPNTTDLTETKPGIGSDPKVVFFGSMDSTANRTGYEFVCRKLYPLIEETLDRLDVKIVVVGRGTDSLPKLTRKRIEIIGEVDSISKVITESQFAVLPIFVASGTNTRVIEAAMCGRAVLTTPLALEGLVDESIERMSVDSAEQMAHECIRMLTSNSYTIEKATKLQHEIASKFSFREFTRSLKHNVVT